MPTNTTTPEAATTTTPATNTNTTPLSAMTGEEVASILVGLIRQNDGVLIQQKVTDGINQSAYVTAYQTLKNQIDNDLETLRAAFVSKFQSVGLDIPNNASLQDVYNKIVDFVTIAPTQTEFVSGYTGYNDIIQFMNNATYNITMIKKAYTSLTSTNGRLRYCNQCYYGRFPNITTWGYYHFDECVFEIFYAPNILNTGDISGNIGGCFTRSSNLIDLTCGSAFIGNHNMQTINYNPSTAMRNDSFSLCHSDDITVYAIEMARENKTTPFNNNREKWNLLLRQHFAYNLPDRTGLTAYTITFGSTILANMEQATLDAFTAKNWTLA